MSDTEDAVRAEVRRAQALTMGELSESLDAIMERFPELALDLNWADVILTLALNPLADEYARQHDLRERFTHALEEIGAVQAEPRAYRDAFNRCKGIAAEALDPRSIREWEEMKRPLPWLDEVVGDGAALLTEVVNGLAPSI